MTKPYMEQDLARIRMEREAAHQECAELRAELSDLRERIARDIQEARFQFMRVTGAPANSIAVLAFEDAARIARGQS